MRRLLACGYLAWVLGMGTPAAAAGLFLAPRGVRPLAMGGAFVAGADDVNALSYNPAGLSEAGDMLLVDAALPVSQSTYTRSVLGDTAYEAPVEGTGMGLPSPTLGAVCGFGLHPSLRFGLALATDYPLMQNWPSTGVDPTAAQRYAIGDYRGTALSKLIAGAGFRINDWLSVGGSVQLLVGNFAATTTASTCDGVLCTQAENPAYDATVQMRADHVVIPGAQLGIQLRPQPWLKVGLAWESGYSIDHSATLSIRLPSAPAYDGAGVNSTAPNGRLSMTLPQQLRAGVLVQPHPDIRVEAAYVYEPWSAHDAITLNTGDLAVSNMLGVGNYALGTITIPQGFADTWSVRLGSEYQVPVQERSLSLRAGVMYEPSAIPVAMLTPMAVDLNKLLVAAGAQYTLQRFRLQVTYAHVFMFDQLVTTSQVYQTNPTHPGTADLTPIGNGLYQSGADVFGVGLHIDI